MVLGYRHYFHIGNTSDIFKHLTLTTALQIFIKQSIIDTSYLSASSPSIIPLRHPFPSTLIIDTHSASSIYNVTTPVPTPSSLSRRPNFSPPITNEYHRGLSRLIQYANNHSPPPSSIPYLNILRYLNVTLKKKSSSALSPIPLPLSTPFPTVHRMVMEEEIKWVAGSPLLIYGMLSSILDKSEKNNKILPLKVVFNELHTTDFNILKKVFKGSGNTNSDYDGDNHSNKSKHSDNHLSSSDITMNRLMSSFPLPFPTPISSHFSKSYLSLLSSSAYDLFSSSSSSSSSSLNHPLIKLSDYENAFIFIDPSFEDGAEGENVESMVMDIMQSQLKRQNNASNGNGKWIFLWYPLMIGEKGERILSKMNALMGKISQIIIRDKNKNISSHAFDIKMELEKVQEIPHSSSPSTSPSSLLSVSAGSNHTNSIKDKNSHQSDDNDNSDKGEKKRVGKRSSLYGSGLIVIHPSSSSSASSPLSSNPKVAIGLSPLLKIIQSELIPLMKNIFKDQKNEFTPKETITILG